MTTCTLLVVSLIVAQADEHTRVAEKIIAAINADDQAAIQAMFSTQMRKALPKEKSAEFFRGIATNRGKITKFSMTSHQGDTATFELTCDRGKLEMQLTINESSLIAGLFIRPPKPTVPAPDRNSMPLRLPFADEWSVFWGGSTVEQNYHVNTPNQRRALDLVIRDKSGSSHSGSGRRNEDYYCYGKEVLSPGQGKVVTVIDGVPDNEPGSLNSYSAVGNCVIIRHADRIYSVLAHFQPGSLRVKLDQEVNPGDILGKCGNSGNSSEPHLHFHLQHLPVLQDGLGVEPYFHNVRVTRNGKTTTEKEYTPIRGDLIKPE